MDTTKLSRLLHRPADANKYDFGHVLVIGGSPDMPGSILMAGEGALRIGAGVATVVSDKETISRVAGQKQELITLGLSESYSPQDAQNLLNYIKAHAVSAVAMGPGLAPGEAYSFVRHILPHIDVPMVLDAGGIDAFKKHISLLSDVAESQPIIITPHVGEFSALTGDEYESHADAGAAAKEFAEEHGLTVVLKGHRTLVVRPSGKAFVNLTGNPGMATAGAGDVLTGMIAGLVSQKMPLHDAVEIAVYVHGLAGDIAAEEETEPGMIAGDIIKNIPAALQKIAYAER